jgi:hypothetical protein
MSTLDKTIAGLVGGLLAYFIVYMIYMKLYVKESFAAPVCKTPPPALLDYIDTNYPHYDTGTPYRPLSTLNDSHQMVDFEQVNKTSLYK